MRGVLMLPVPLQLPAARADNGSNMRSAAIDSAITKDQPGLWLLCLREPTPWVAGVDIGAREDGAIVCT